MKQFLLITSLILFAVQYSICQEVIAASGDDAASADLSISWTIGETVTGTFENSNGILTQGIHQGYLTVTPINETQELNFEISAFPNPASDILRIRVESNTTEGLSYILLDAQGRLLLQDNIYGNMTEIPFTNYAPAIYFLKIREGQKEIMCFKIIKSKFN
ncbi:MAG: T9SS type A sorting domain-containing protein [Bacteroidales bacterium]|nr:T9SS type A sorting domain-containing protein [Bacteroidales bacterium]